MLHDARRGKLFTLWASTEAGHGTNVGEAISAVDQGSLGVPPRRELVAPEDDLVLGTGRSPAGQVPEAPFGCLLAGDRPVLSVPPAGEEVDGGGGGGATTINTVIVWTFYLYISAEHYGRVDKSKSLL